MLQSVKIASLNLCGDTREDVEAKVGSKMLEICGKRLLTPNVSFSCSVKWVDNPESSSFKAVLIVFYNYDSSEIEERHCQICRETHDSFYCNRQYNCNQCAFAAYKYRRTEKAVAMRSGGKNALKSLFGK